MQRLNWLWLGTPISDFLVNHCHNLSTWVFSPWWSRLISPSSNCFLTRMDICSRLVPQGTYLSRMLQMRVAHLTKNQICFTMRVSASLAVRSLIQIRGWSGLGKIITWIPNSLIQTSTVEVHQARYLSFYPINPPMTLRLRKSLWAKRGKHCENSRNLCSRVPVHRP